MQRCTFPVRRSFLKTMRLGCRACRDLAEARAALQNLNLVGTPYSEKLPTAQLHWLIADKTGSIVLEAMKDGLHVYENPVGVLTNNPPFPMQLFALNNFVQLSPKPPVVPRTQSPHIRHASSQMPTRATSPRNMVLLAG